MQMIGCMVLFVIFQTKAVFSNPDPDLNKDSRVCYDKNKNVIACRYYAHNDCHAYSGCKRRYYVAKDKVETMAEARNKCKERRMRLVSIETSRKWDDVVEAIKRSGTTPNHYFTSATNNTQDPNKFVWGTGCPFSFVNWATRGRDNSLTTTRTLKTVLK